MAMNPPFFPAFRGFFEGIPVILSDGFQVPFDAWTELKYVSSLDLSKRSRR
jgi:hypothetical protein